MQRRRLTVLFVLLSSRPVAGSARSGCWQAVASSAGGAHSLAIRSDGTAWSWGASFHGQLGNGSTEPSPFPVEVAGLSGAVAVAAGEAHSLAVLRDGSLWVWGSNLSGQIGNGAGSLFELRPVRIVGLPDIVAASAGGEHTLAVARDGTAWSWGRGNEGQLGRTDDPTVPAPVTGLAGVVAVAAGLYHSLALRSDGTVWAWGDNTVGELGDGTTVLRRFTPVQVVGLDDAVAIACDGGSSSRLDASHALTRNGLLWSWGDNSYGQLGDGTTNGSRVPVQAVGLDRVVGFDADLIHGVALRDDGTVWAWGNNGAGQFGDGTNQSSLVAVPVTTLPPTAGVEAGYGFSLLRLADGTLQGTGTNWSGQLGDCSFDDRNLPVEVDFPDGRKPVIVTCPADHSAECPADLAPGAAGQASATSGCRPQPVSFSDAVVPACARAVQRTWESSDGCRFGSCEQRVTEIDSIPPVVTAALTPLGPLPPGSPGSPVSGFFRVACTAEDACDPAVATRALLHVASRDRETCAPSSDVVTISCGELVAIQILPPACRPRSARPPRPARPASSAGVTSVRGESVALEVRGIDACGNSSTATAVLP